MNTAQIITAILFYLFAGLTAAGAIGVVLSRNIVRTAVLLMFTLLGVAGLFFLLHSEFLAAVQIVVYVGATLILIVFGVMLTNRGAFNQNQPKRAEIAAALAIGIVMLTALVAGILALPAASTNPPPTPTEYPIARLGVELLGDYLIPFELASILLLLTMIGAAYLAKGRRERRDPSKDVSQLSQQARQWS